MPDVRPDLSDSRFYAILDTAYVKPTSWRSVCQDLIDGGAALIQVRAKHATPDQREELLQQVLPLFERRARTAPAAPVLIVNDDVELCARHPGVGLHIGQEDTPPIEARRRVGPDRVIGLSTHSLEQIHAAQALAPGIIDYFCVGPVFATQTKPDYAPVGLELVRLVAASTPRLPWFAIGGVNRTTLTEVAAAGALRVVAVSDVLQDPRPADAVRHHLRELQRLSRR
ncbi:MAG: thiamine phosphate synthase [Opitutaceae bacterium]